MSFKPVALNVIVAPASLCQHVNVVRSVFCHPHVSFLAKSLFTTVKLVGSVTVYDVKSANSPHHIRRKFPSVHCTRSIHRNFSYRKHENVTSFPLPSSNLLLSPVIKSHLSLLSSKLNLSPRHSFPPGTSSPPNFQHVSSTIKICLSIMTLFSMILPNQPTQYILVTLSGKKSLGKVTKFSASDKIFPQRNFSPTFFFPNSVFPRFFSPDKEFIPILF